LVTEEINNIEVISLTWSTSARLWKSCDYLMMPKLT